MTRASRVLATILFALTALWLLADRWWQSPIVFGALRDAAVQGTGLIAIGAMSVGMVLAARPGFVEPWLGGLDKMIRLHKWLGVSAMAAAVTHWGWTQAPKWLVGLGWMERPARGAARLPDDALDRFLLGQRGLAESVGEAAFYAALIGVALALFKRFPYHLFFKTHRLLALVYVALVAHAVVLLDYPLWRTPLGAVLALLMAAGTAAALYIGLGRVGVRRRAVAELLAVDWQAGMQVLELTLQLRSRWRAPVAGQFAFLTFDGREGPHPFTLIASARDDGVLRVLIKALGDYTRTLSTTLKAGALVTLEGPYGRFDFSGGPPQQIWISGGIGITPFIARMQHLAAHRNGAHVDLFHSTGPIDAVTEARLRGDAAAAGVTLHLTVDGRDERMGVSQICRRVPHWLQGDVWFCGPAAFGRDVRSGFQARGLAPDRFHQEFFEWR